MSEKLAYLGWGIIGTPKGRQAVGDGVDKQLGLAKNFDLAQEFGSCLPEPKQDPNFSEVLYCLSLQTASKHYVLGLAEYRPAYEQGQSRSGSYFGAFIEATSCSFGETSLSTLFSALYELSAFQYQAFIDPNTRNYKESIQGKAFQAPQEKLLQIAEQIQPLGANLLSQTATEETLFVQCGKGKVVEALKTLLNEQLYYRFKHIYFTESDYIASQMQGKKIAKMHLSYLENSRFFTDSYRKEILHLHQQNGQYRTHLKKAEEDLAAEKANQAQQIAAQVQQKTVEVRTQLEQQVEQYKQQAENATQSVADLRQSAEFGKQVLSLAANQNNPQLNSGEYVSNAQLAKQLSKIERQLQRPNNPSHSQYNESESKTIERKQPLNLVFVILSAVLFVILLGVGVYSLFFDKQPKVDSKVELALKETKMKLETAEKALQSKNDELEDLKKQSASLPDTTPTKAAILEDFISEICIANPKDSKNLSTPNKYKAEITRDKLCKSSD